MNRPRRRRPVPGRGRVLQVEGISVAFGAVQALDRVGLAVHEGAFVGLIGPNGAGKTTLFNVISGFVTPSSGRIRLAGRRIERWPAARRARGGVARTFQNVGLDKSATVLDNLRLAWDGGALTDEIIALVRPRAGKGEAFDERVGDLLGRLGLSGVLHHRVDRLPLGTAKLVELVWALLRRPRLLLLDEPSSGLSPQERTRLGELLVDLHRRERLSVLMIEHDMGLAMNTVDYLYVLDFGSVIAHGRPEQVRRDPLVIEAYLGKAASR